MGVDTFMVLIAFIFCFLGQLSASAQELCSEDCYALPEDMVEVCLVNKYLKNQDCPRWIRERKGLKKCPKRGANQLLSEAYPTAVHFMYDDDGPNLESRIEEIIRNSHPDKIPLIRINDISYKMTDELIKRLKQKFQNSPHAKVRLEKYISPASLQNSSNYLRDSIRSYIDQSGRIKILGIKDGIPQLEDMSLPKNCGFEIEDKTVADPGQTKLGGNLMSIAPGICVASEVTSLHEKLGCSQENTALIQPHSGVKHIDEYVMTSPQIDEQGCPKHLFIASPEKSLEIIQEQIKNGSGKLQAFKFPFHRESKTITNTELDPEDEARLTEKQMRVSFKTLKDLYGIFSRSTTNGKIGYENLSGISELCPHLERLPKISLTTHEYEKKYVKKVLRCTDRPRGTVINRKEYKIEEFDITQSSEAEIKSASDSCIQKSLRPLPIQEVDIPHEDPLYQKRGRDTHCENMSVIDLILTLEQSGGIRDFKQVQERINKFKDDLRSKFKKISPRCTPELVDIPVFPTKSYWGMPNTINGIVTSKSSVRMPDSQIPMFNDYVKKTLKERGIEVSFEDFLGVNNFDERSVMSDSDKAQGNLHCSTNSIQICSP